MCTAEELCMRTPNIRSSINRPQGTEITWIHVANYTMEVHVYSTLAYVKVGKEERQLTPTIYMYTKP